MKKLSVVLALLTPILLTAQDEEWKEASPASKAYHEYRLKTTVPPYGLAKVKALIKGIQQDEDTHLKLNAKAYNTLSLREKFTYHMIHAESYSQNCDVFPPVQEEQTKIMAYLPDAFDEYSWSERQRKFMQDNKDSVMAIMKESIQRSGRIGVNYKEAIVEMNALEMIPFLIDFYKKDRKDHDILTVLLLLMKGVKYEPFVKSTSYTKLYGENSSYTSCLQLNAANEELIFKRAMDLYNAMS